MVKIPDQKPVTKAPDQKPVVTPPPPGVNNLDATVSAELMRLKAEMPLVWRQVCGTLLDDMDVVPNPPSHAKFQSDAYQLLARRDGTGEAGLIKVKDALSISKSREPYVRDLERVATSAAFDSPRRLSIHENIQDLLAGGDIKFNTDRFIAGYMGLSQWGREWWQGTAAEVTEWVAPFAAYLMDMGMLMRHVSYEATGDVGLALAIKRQGQLKPLLNLLKLGALAPADNSAKAAAPAAPAGSDDAQKKVWDDQASDLKKEIEPHLPDDGAVGDNAKLKKLSEKEKIGLVQKITNAPAEVKKRLNQDVVFMRRVASLAEGADHHGTQTMMRALDPVEALADSLTGIKVNDKGYLIGGGGGAMMDATKRFELIRDFLMMHADKDPAINQSLAPTRLKVMTHSTISRYVFSLPQPQQQDLWKLTTRGTLEPELSDRLYPSIKSGNAQEVARVLLSIGPQDRTAMQALKDDMLFRTAISNGNMRSVVVVDGVSVRPYDLCLIMWGQSPGLSQDPGKTGPSEVNDAKDPTDPNSKPLTFEERVALDNKLYNPTIKTLESDLSAADGWFSGARTDDDDVADHLDAFATKCASEEFVHLIRRDGHPPGQQLATKYNAKTGNSIHSLIKSGCGAKTRRAAERVLNIAIGSESVGVVGGVVRRAGDGATPEKADLEQVLRETPTSDGGRSIQQVVHSAAADLRRELYEGLCWNGADIEDVIEIWVKLDTAVPQTLLNTVKDKCGTKVFLIELLQNAYLEIDGPLVKALDKRLSNSDGKKASEKMGLTVEGTAARKTEAQGPAKAADPAAAARNDAETRFGAKATELFNQLSALVGIENQGMCAAAKAKFTEYIGLGAQAGQPMPSVTVSKMAVGMEEAADAKAGSGLGTMKTPEDYYRQTYGITPMNHMVQIVRAFHRQEAARPSNSGGTQLTAATVAGWLGVDASVVEGQMPVPAGGAPKIDENNKLLVRQGFTEGTANDMGREIWKLLHEGGEIRLIEATLYAPYNDEEKRLIRQAFRQLSGGIDWQFYVQQAKYSQTHRGDQIGRDRQQTMVGAEGTEAGKEVANDRHITVTADAGELDASLALATQGKVDIKAELANAVSHGEWNIMLRIVDRADDAQCREILADTDLMAKLENKLDKYSWDRVHRVLTGQDGLAVRLESRAHGDHDAVFEGIFGGTHEAGMKDDIKEYVHRLTKKFEAEEVKKAQASNTVPIPEIIAMTVAKRVRDACASLSADPEIADILERELSGLDLVATRGQLITGTGEESNVAAVASNESDHEKIHEEIKRMGKAERESRLRDPQYMQRLTQILYGKQLEYAISLLQSNVDEEAAAKNGDAAGVQDNLASLKKACAMGATHDIDDMLKQLVELTPAEHDRMLADPALVGQLTAIFHNTGKEKREIAERVLGYRKEKADSLIAGDVTHPDGKDNAQGRTVSDDEKQRLAFLQENAIARILQGASVSYNQLLAQCVEVYKMDFHPRGLNTPTPAKVDGKTGAEPKPDGPAPLDPDSALGIQLEQKLREGMWSRIKGNEAVKDRADSKLKMDRVELAVMGLSDPSSFRVLEQWGAFDDDEEGVEDTLRKASEDHVIGDWTSVHLEKPNGEESLATVYYKYRTAHDAALEARKTNPDPNASKEMPADVQALRAAYMNYVIDVSGSFEDLVLNFAGGVFSDSDPTKKDKKRSKTKQRDNEDYLKWRAIIRSRIPELSPAKIAKKIQATDRPDDVELIMNPNRKAKTQFEFHEDEYTRRLGTSGSGARVAGGKRAAVTDTMARYGQELSDAESNDNGEGRGIVTKSEGEGLTRTAADVDLAMKEFTDARAKIAGIAGAIVGLIAGAIVTIITGGAGAGLAWMLVAGALSGAAGAAGTALTKEAIQGSEFDFSHEGLTSIAQGAITGMVMAGTTRLAGNIMKSLTGPATMKAQATMLQHVLNGTKPDLWERVLSGAQGLGFATGEGVLAEGLNVGIEAGIAPLDPSLWVHGFDEGVIRARHKIRDQISAAPQRLFNAGVMSALTHSVGAMRGKGGEDGAHPPTDLDKPKIKGSLEWHIDRMKHNAAHYGKVDDVMVMAFSSFVSQKISAGVFGKPIDWSNPEEQIFMEFLTAWQGLAPNVHADHRRLVFERKEGLSKQLEKFGKELKTEQERAHYISLNPEHAIGEILTVAQYLAARKGMFEAALGVTEAGYKGKHTLNDKQRAIFEQWCREATDSADYASRIRKDPLTLDIVKAAADPVKAATVPPPPPTTTTPPPVADVHAKKNPDEHEDKKPTVTANGDGTTTEVKKPPTIDDLMEVKGASDPIKASTYSGQEHTEHQPAKIQEAVAKALPFVAAQFPHGTAEIISGTNAILVNLKGGNGKEAIIIEVRVIPSESASVANFHFTGMENAVIDVSDRARVEHVERAVADLMTEIRATREAQLAGKEIPKAGALKPGSKSKDLTPADLGNIAQLKSLLRQLENAKQPIGGEPSNPETIKHVNIEITALLDSLGVTGMEGGRLAELIEPNLSLRERQELQDRHREAPPPAKRVGVDANHDGVTDAAKVGVGGMEIPDKIPRLENLPPDQKAAQDRFAEAYETPGGKEAMAKQYLDSVTAEKNGNGKKRSELDKKTFATDEAKDLSEDYNRDEPGVSDADVKAARARMNIAVHQTANAVAKLAFIMRLDQIAQSEGGGTILVTAGGVGAGKGHAIENNKVAAEMASRAKVVWDTAGEQNSTELPWVIAEAKKRGLSVEILYVHQKPENSWENMDFGVIPRAKGKGRMVDARLHADSYAEGARNFDAVQKQFPGVKTVIVDVTRGDAQEIPRLPKEALKLDAEKVYQRNVEFLKKQQGLSEAIKFGGSEQGEMIWGPPEHRAAIAELGEIPVSSVAAGTVVQGGDGKPLDHNTYFVSVESGKRMLEPLQKLGPDVSVRTFKGGAGFVVRRVEDGKISEWYFETNDHAAKQGAQNVQGPRTESGLPKPNAATIELWGFSGVREINGRKKADWTEAEKAQVQRARDQEPLLFAGHIGISLDGGKTIIGFTPKPPENMLMKDFLQSLMNHDAYPGIVGDDTHIFVKAAEMARERGWDTKPISAVEFVDQTKKLEVADQAAKLSGMEAGEHGYGYSFPLKPEDIKPGEQPFAESNGFKADCVKNCGMFPQEMGVKIPEATGNVKLYMPELQKWVDKDAPVDLRTKQDDSADKEKAKK